MKISTLLIGASLVLAGTAAFILIPGEKKVAAYSPRVKDAEGSFLDAVHYLRLLRGNLETGDFEPSDYQEMAQAVSLFDRNHTGERSVEMSWWEMGPNNIGGRTRAICAVTNDLLFAGGTTSGLFKSINGGNNWERVEVLDSFGKTLALSCIDRTGDGSIYFGTGSIFESGFDGSGASSSIGVGLFRSTDLGATWSIVPGTEPAAFGGGDDWAYINDICADPTNPNRIWIAGNAGIGYYDAATGELNMDLDGIPTSSGHDIEWAPDGSYVLAGIANGRVFKSTNGGASFSQVGAGILTNRQRVRIAISPDDVSKIYVLYAQGGFMGGLYYSPDAGSSWSEKWPPGVDAVYSVFGDNGQAYYDLALAVKPGDPTTCWVGGVTLWQSGSDTQPEQIAFNFDIGSSELYVHSDIHTFEIAPNGDWYIGCDGGIFKSVDGGQSFMAMNRGYATTQFYAIAHSGGYPVLGGTQDNGTILLPGMEFPVFETDSWQQGIVVSGGDGFDCDLSNVTEPGATVAFTSIYYGALSRFNAQGSGGGYFDNDVLSAIGTDGEAGSFYTAARLYENTADENSQQFSILFNNRNEDLYSYIEGEDTIWLDTTLFTRNMTLPFGFRFPLGDTLHFWETLVRPEIWSTEPLTEDPNYPWLDLQELTSTVDSCITDSMLVGFETVIDEIIEETIWVYFEDSVFVEEIGEWVYFSDSTEVVIDTDTTFIEVPVYEFETICTTWYFYASDVLENVREEWLVQDQFTSMMVTGFFGSEGMWLTREALNFNVTPDWWKIGNAPTSGVRTFEFTEDGKTLFYSSWSGQLFRVRNLDQLWSAADVPNLEIDQIISGAGGTVTSIASDPHNPNHLVITVGGYGSVGGGKVRESNNALAENPTFSNIWDFSGDEAVLERMPIYASVIDVSDESGNTIVVGADFGIWATSDGGDTWVHSGDPSDGIPNYPQAGPSLGSLRYTPVFDLRQQQVGIKPYMNPENYGTIYAGSHGRGIWRSDDFFSVGVEELDPQTAEAGSILIYPNPSEGEAFINVDMKVPYSGGFISIYTVTGQLAKQFGTGQLAAGSNRIAIRSEDLPAGHYIVRLDAGEASGIGKFVKR